MARLVIGLNQSLDGYVDHTAFGPSPVLSRHVIEEVREQAGSSYGRRMYEIMRSWDVAQPEWSDDARACANAWRRLPKWVVSRTAPSLGPHATLVGTDLAAAIQSIKDRVDGEMSVAAPASVNVPDDPVARTCVCPASQSLYRTEAASVTRDHLGEAFRGTRRDCALCPLRAQCLRTPATMPVRYVAFFPDHVGRRLNYSALMRERIDSAAGRAQYAQRFATVEPVFADLRANQRLDQFTLRGRVNVDTQWKLNCLVHNSEKPATSGYAA
jgi:hypothetical protein